MPNPNSNIAVRRFQCRHIFTNGHRCGSACLKGEDFCYYHHTTRRPKQVRPHDPYNEPPNQTSFILPTPEDASAIQHGIGEIMNQLASNALDPRRAGLLLYALQIASLNLKTNQSKQDKREDEDPVEEITLDPVLGPLAPTAEVGENRKKGVIELWVEQMDNFDRESAERQANTVSLQGAADTKRAQRCRYTLKP